MFVPGCFPKKDKTASRKQSFGFKRFRHQYFTQRTFSFLYSEDRLKFSDHFSGHGSVAQYSSGIFILYFFGSETELAEDTDWRAYSVRRIWEHVICWNTCYSIAVW